MIKNVVIVDDSQYKQDKIKEYIKKLLPDSNIRVFSCINDGLCFICREQRQEILANPDDWLVITDMVMPRREGEPMNRFGGFIILSEMRRIGMSCPAIVASSMSMSLSDCQVNYRNTVGVVRESSTVYTYGDYQAILNELNS